uniref:Uncharacterized protein n=1 Tax=Sphaerodactylus townsendi TaxID=933632 RepID=A0ACB8EXB8_9SAUR
MERAAAMTDMYDQALLGILQHVGNVQEFLNILFGFLYRKTDFYRLLLQPGDRLGFPPGVAKSMAVRAFKNFEDLAHQDDERRQRELEEKLKKREEEAAAAAAAERMKVPVAAEEVEISSGAEQNTASGDGKAAEAPDSVTVQDKLNAVAFQGVIKNVPGPFQSAYAYASVKEAVGLPSYISGRNKGEAAIVM